MTIKHGNEMIKKYNDSIKNTPNNTLNKKHSKPNLKQLTLYFDGASRGNPGLSSSSAIIFDDKNKCIIKEKSNIHKYEMTNNMAEYYGLIYGLELLIHNNLMNDKITVLGDSKLVIEQVFGTWKCQSDKIKPLNEQAKKLMVRFKNISGRWIPRTLNQMADALCNKVLNGLIRI
jgi:ribonuclease HI